MNELELADWRRQMSELYAAVRASSEPRAAHELWRRRRDELFKNHSQSPLPPGDHLRTTGLSYWPYDRALRFEVPVLPTCDLVELLVETDQGTVTSLRRVASVELPAPLEVTVDLWWLAQYGGGLFLPLRDGTSGDTSYGGGRYLLDTAKGADLGGGEGTLIIDLNFLYHPSCRYSSAWRCPLAPSGNTIAPAVRAGERL